MADHDGKSCYKAGCRIDVCRELHAQAMKRYRARVAMGIAHANDLVAADNTRRHLGWLTAEGMTYRQIAAHAGMSTVSNQVSRIARGVTTTITRRTEQALMAIRP